MERGEWEMSDIRPVYAEDCAIEVTEEMTVVNTLTAALLSTGIDPTMAVETAFRTFDIIRRKAAERLEHRILEETRRRKGY